MCGIFGVYLRDRSTAPRGDLLEPSTASLSHRGPDAKATHVGGGIALGHTRLSFLDLSAEGNQPFWDVTRRYCIVYNGEIYNFRELRAQLEQQGYSFRTGSDTEVLLYGLIAHGPSFLRSANGMFAFGLYDSSLHTLLLGRDRFGIKPLYVAARSDGIVFSSEVRAMRDWLEIRPDERMLAAYLTGFDLPTSGHTFVDGVSFFPTGSTALYSSDRRETHATPYFSLEEFSDSDLRQSLASSTPSKLIDRLDELLNESVRLHMIADVPVGALCSGGVDSSLILALATKHSSSLAIFHANVVGPHSEFDAARALAEHLHLELIHVDSKDSDFIDLIPDVTTTFEFPFLYHPNSVPFLQVSRLVKENGTKAVLTGEGSDEILLGYSDIPLRRLIARYHRAADGLRGLMHRLPWVGKLLWRNPEDSQAPIGRQLITGFEAKAYPAWIASRSSAADRDGTEAMFSLLGYHLRTLLMRNDRLGMAASIEARFPYLENELVRYSANLPYNMKIRRCMEGMSEIRHPFVLTKWILRQVAARYLPRELAFRVKRGFPTSAFDRLHVNAGYFDDSWLQRHYQLDRHSMSYLKSKATRSDLLRLMLLDVWGRVVIEETDNGTITSLLRSHLSFRRS